MPGCDCCQPCECPCGMDNIKAHIVNEDCDFDFEVTLSRDSNYGSQCLYTYSGSVSGVGSVSISFNCRTFDTKLTIGGLTVANQGSETSPDPFIVDTELTGEWCDGQESSTNVTFECKCTCNVLYESISLDFGVNTGTSPEWCTCALDGPITLDFVSGNSTSATYRYTDPDEDACISVIEVTLTCHNSGSVLVEVNWGFETVYRAYICGPGPYTIPMFTDGYICRPDNVFLYLPEELCACCCAFQPGQTICATFVVDGTGTIPDTTMTFTSGGFFASIVVCDEEIPAFISLECASNGLPWYFRFFDGSNNVIGDSVETTEFTCDRTGTAEFDLDWNCFGDPAHVTVTFSPGPC